MNRIFTIFYTILIVSVIFIIPNHKVYSQVSDFIEKTIYGLDGQSSFDFHKYGETCTVTYTVYTDAGISVAPATGGTNPDIQSYTILPKQYGEYSISVHYVCADSKDTGTEYIRVHVLPKTPVSRAVRIPNGRELLAIGLIKLNYTTYDKNGIATKNIGEFPTFTDNTVILKGYPTFMASVLNFRSEEILKAPPQRDIMLGFYRDNFNNTWSLGSNGTIYSSTYSPKLKSFYAPREIGFISPDMNSNEALKSIYSYDDTYVVSNISVHVSRDELKTWQMDTAGLNGAIVNKIAIDSSNNIYAATSKGIFKQGPKDNVWTAVTSIPVSWYQTIDVNNDDVLYASSFSAIYKSADRSKTWSLDTAGIQSGGAVRFVQDSIGNMYTVIDNYQYPNKLYKKMKGSSQWTKIGQQFDNMALDATTTPVINDIAAGSYVYLVTSFGFYFSSDQGTSWTQANSGIRSNFSSNSNGYTNLLVKTSARKFFISTPLGIFSLANGDSVWKKIFPTNGFAFFRPIFRDNSGALYSFGARPGLYNGLNNNMKSTDEGASWTLDTLGNYAIQNGSYYVDETGRQYVASSVTNSSITSLVMLSKLSGETWKTEKILDSIPLSNYFSILAFGSDGKGSVYMSIGANSQCYNVKRNANGTWNLDTSGFNINGDLILSYSPDNSGNLVAGTFSLNSTSRVWLRKNGKWSPLPFPASLPSCQGQTATIDAKGNIIAGFFEYTGYSNLCRGIYSTSDLGKTWKYLGLDSVLIYNLKSFGDTSYALTINGLYAFTPDGFTDVPFDFSNISVPPSMVVYPNPATNNIKISYSLTNETDNLVDISLLNESGQYIDRLVSAVQPSGEYIKNYNTEKLVNGAYLCRFEINGVTTISKFVISR